MAHTPLIMHGNTVESVRSTKLLGVHITDDMDYKEHLPCQEGKAVPSLSAMDEVSKPPPPVLRNFYRDTIEYHDQQPLSLAL